jgi:hypothetical protein
MTEAPELTPPPARVDPPTLKVAPPVDATLGTVTNLYNLGFGGLVVGSAMSIIFP